MNTVNIMLNNIKFSIPKEILQLTYYKDDVYVSMQDSLDSRILDKTLRPRLFVDLSIIGGVRLDINLKQTNIYAADVNKFIVDIPDGLLGGRNIVSVHSLVSGVELNTNNDVINNLYNNNYAKINNIVQTARIEILNRRTLLIEDTTFAEDFVTILPNLLIRLVVDHDDNLSAIPPRSIPLVSDIAVQCTKAYIYNTMVISLDKGQVYSGHELGSIKEIIDSYSDADELYRTMLKEKWFKVSMMIDEKSMGDYIKAAIGNVH